MRFDVQKASFTKRISAYLFDIILLACLTAGFAAGLSALLDYDAYNQQLDDAYTKYAQEYQVDFNISAEAYEKLTEVELAQYEAALDALNKDEQTLQVYFMVINLTLVIVSLSLLLSYLVLELVVPLMFKNGQTLGKKIFGICLMRTDGVRVTPFMMVVRTVLGKYTLETMIPVMIVLMLLFSIAGMMGILILGLILLLQVILLIATRNHSVIHDLLACTVVVDASSQMIFDLPESLLKYQKKVQAEKASEADY